MARLAGSRVADEVKTGSCDAAAGALMGGAAQPAPKKATEHHTAEDRQCLLTTLNESQRQSKAQQESNSKSSLVPSPKPKKEIEFERWTARGLARRSFQRTASGLGERLRPRNLPSGDPRTRGPEALGAQKGKGCFKI